jgi:hypothetical protein
MAGQTVEKTMWIFVGESGGPVAGRRFTRYSTGRDQVLVLSV